jgi:hypothetical protein
LGLQAGGRRFDPGTLHKSPANWYIFCCLREHERHLTARPRLALPPVTAARSRKSPLAATPADPAGAQLAVARHGACLQGFSHVGTWSLPSIPHRSRARSVLRVRLHTRRIPSASVRADGGARSGASSSGCRRGETAPSRCSSSTRTRDSPSRWRFRPLNPLTVRFRVEPLCDRDRRARLADQRAEPTRAIYAPEGSAGVSESSLRGRRGRLSRERRRRLRHRTDDLRRRRPYSLRGLPRALVFGVRALEGRPPARAERPPFGLLSG